MPIWAPQPGPQTMAVLTPARQIGYGGAAGGGKTDLILGLALTEHRRSFISRVEGTQLQAIIDRSKEIIESYTPLANFNGKDKIWSKLPGRRTIRMAGMPTLGDEKKFQGHPHDLKAFDEATEFKESQVRFVSGWLRSSDPLQRLRVLLTFNPPTTSDGQWVVKFFAPWIDKKYPKPAAPGELRFFTTIDGKETEVETGEPFIYNGKKVTPMSRTFIPAKLADNAYYSSGDYESVLQAMPEPLRSQMLYGDFGAGIKDDPWQVIPTAWVEQAQERWRKLNALAEWNRPPLSTIGVDVARGGSDSTVLSPRYGFYFDWLQKLPGSSTPDGEAVAGAVLRKMSEIGSSDGTTMPIGFAVNVDVIGVGASAYDALKRNRGFRTYAVNAAEGSTATDRSKTLQFANIRAQMLWQLREALDPRTGDNLALPDDPELLADLTAAKWHLRSGRIYIEAKEDIKARIGRSPDKGDALVLAHHVSNKQIKIYTLEDLEAQGY